MKPSVHATTRRITATLLLVASALPFRALHAHEVPNRVTVLAFIRPLGSRLQLLLRVPLAAMRDMEFPQRGAYLDLSMTDQSLRDASRLWLADYIKLYERDRALGTPDVRAVRISLPSDRSFESFDAALKHVNGAPLPVTTELPLQQAMLDVAFDYPIRSEDGPFSIDPVLARLGIQTTTVLRFLPRKGGERAFRYVGDPGLVPLDPSWWHAVARFVAGGFQHILDGLDHLLFIFCLVIPVRRLRPLVAIVTSFTVAHSITLIASSFGLAPDALWFPPLIETLIALSIVWMAFENIMGARLEHRWAMAFGFGLVHGFGFSFALRESMQFAGTHLLTALLAFNVGVELGQLLVVAIAVPVLALTLGRLGSRRSAAPESGVPAPRSPLTDPGRMGVILLSALVAHTAWHWMVDRLTTLRTYSWQRPLWDLQLAIGVMRLGMLALIIAAAAWLLSSALKRLRGAESSEQRAATSST